MELRQLRYFKAIADARSFAKGAHQLCVAQPALSRSIAGLEDELGQVVFFRHSAGVTLTDAGARLYKHATEVLNRMQMLTDEMAADLGIPHGSVSLGVPPSIQAILTAPIAAEFIKAYPAATLNVIQNTSANLRDAVTAGRIDIAIISTLSPVRGLNYTPLLTEGMCLIERADAPPRLKSTIDIADLSSEPLIVCGHPNLMRAFLEEAFEAQQITPNIRCEVNTSSLVLDLVSQGAGAGIAPSCAVASHPSDNLRFTPINSLRFTWTIATSYERIGSASVIQLGAMLRERAVDLIQTGRWPTASLDSCEPPADNLIKLTA